MSLLLSGLSTIAHVQENIKSVRCSGPDTMSEEKLAAIAREWEIYEALCPVSCSDCQYCLPCPGGVNIPRTFEIYNDLMMYGDEQHAQLEYSWIDEDKRGNMCIACGECLEKCPQQIEIPDWLTKAHEVLCKGGVRTTGVADAH